MKIEIKTDEHLDAIDISMIEMRMKECKTMHIEKLKGKISFCFDEDIKAEMKKDPKTDALRSSVKEVISFLNKEAGKRFSAVSKTNVSIISQRMKDGAKLDDFKKVIRIKTAQWKDDPKMDQYLCPATLFRASNFERYLNQKDLIGGGQEAFNELDKILGVQ